MKKKIPYLKEAVFDKSLLYCQNEVKWPLKTGLKKTSVPTSRKITYVKKFKGKKTQLFKKTSVPKIIFF